MNGCGGIPRTSKLPVILIIGILQALLVPTTWAAELADSQYVDPKGFFKIVPPAGWRIQGYPQDPRGKVALFGPEGVEIRALINSVDFDTIDALLAFCHDVEKRTGLNTHIARTEFQERPAVERWYEVKGQKMYLIDFLVGKVDHNLQYAAALRAFDSYKALVLKSWQTYDPIVKNLSEAEARQHGVAKSLRLAQLMLQEGNRQLASEYVKEGLGIDATNADLLRLKNQIDQAGHR